MTSPLIKKLVENLQADLRALSSESKRKYPPVKEAAESGLLKIRTVANRQDDILSGLLSSSSELIQPLILGCDTKNHKIVQICLLSVQRLVQHQAVSVTAASTIINMLWNLMEAGIEELKLLQTATLLITTNTVVQHDSLAKAVVLCFRLHFTKDSTTNNTASATVRQLVRVVYERVIAEDSLPTTEPQEPINYDQLKAGGRTAPHSLRSCAQDGYLLFQDFCHLVNADQPNWLVGMTEMTRTFGLELMESVLTSFPQIFHKHPEFSFLLKERVCQIIIKLFSPSLKYRHGVPNLSHSTGAPVEKPYFPIVMRLLRLVSVLIKHFYSLLVTECEIFLSLLVKFLDGDKPLWQRSLALEVLHTLSTQPNLIRCFCQSYDMKPHSTKIFRDIVNAIGSFIQSLFLSPVSTVSHTKGEKSPDTTGQSPSLVAGLPVGSGVTPQPAFTYRGVWIPIVYSVGANPGVAKAVFLEMLDKVEPPGIPEGYGMTVSFACLLDIVRSVQIVIEGESGTRLSSVADPKAGQKLPDGEKRLNEELINSSWCGVLAALSLLLDASTDETATESILKSQQTFVSLCGKMAMLTPRDAFITALCKASLPPHYTLTVLNSHTAVNPHKGPDVLRKISQDQESIERSQVVAVGTPLPSASTPAGSVQGSVMLTAKNIQSMRALLSVTHCHGGVLGTAWHLVLTTLQHLVWILGLKPSIGGSLQASKQATDGPNTVLTTAVMSDLPVLSAMLSRLFESSQYLDDVALHHLIDALCKLSAESMELAYSNREPSLFAVAKLLETGLVNLPRVEVLWKPVSNHLLEVCQHPHTAMRSWGAEAVTSLIKAALGHRYVPPLSENTRILSMILTPLQELSTITHSDVRQKQLECVLSALQNSGDSLGHGWPVVLAVLGAATDQGENLIRMAFQSLQLVVTDYLPIMPSPCMRICIEVAAKFGVQQQELNISLTSIGLLWNVSDFLFQNKDKIMVDDGQDGQQQQMPVFDSLWMTLFAQLGLLCVDSRPAVRKSAGQTLFSTITAHGDLLQNNTWTAVLWKVLFPLLEKVKNTSREASNVKEGNTMGNILIHHSRDSPAKQWSETQVLTLAGVSQVFNLKRSVLHQIPDFPRAWQLLLEFIESSALYQNPEVSLEALKSFQEILQIKTNGAYPVAQASVTQNGVGMTASIPSPQILAPEHEHMDRSSDKTLTDRTSNVLVEESVLWNSAWKVWLSIGCKVTHPPDKTHKNMYIPSQPFLSNLIKIFPALFSHIKGRFSSTDLGKLTSVLTSALSVPVHGEASPFIVPMYQDVNLTKLQQAVLHATDVLHKEALGGSESMQSMYPDLFSQLITFVQYSVAPPTFGSIVTQSIEKSVPGQQADWVTMNFVPFAEAALKKVVEMYKLTAKHKAVIDNKVLHNIIKCLRRPLGLKYGCPSKTTWVQAINALLVMLSVGLPLARKHEMSFQSMWLELAECIEEFLFANQTHASPSNMTVDDYLRDEAIDCKVVQVIRDDILPHSMTVPKQFVVHTMKILNRGSIHAAMNYDSEFMFDMDSSAKHREEFAKTCFETLLQYSFLSKGKEGFSQQEEGAISKLAIASLLTRCNEALKAYIQDEKRSGHCPLPRTRNSEMSFVLQALGTLLVSLKKAPHSSIESKVWTQVIDLYPLLVELTMSDTPVVRKPLKGLLLEYKDLLKPSALMKNGV